MDINIPFIPIFVGINSFVIVVVILEKIQMNI